MNNVFILFGGNGDGEDLISVHKTLENAMKAGDVKLKHSSYRYISIEEHELESETILGFWGKSDNNLDPKYNYDWKKYE